jgi:hypothetical protein
VCAQWKKDSEGVYHDVFSRVVDIKWVDKAEVDSMAPEKRTAIGNLTRTALQWFKYFDQNSDNSISKDELRAGLSQLNLALEDHELSILMEVGAVGWLFPVRPS